MALLNLTMHNQTVKNGLKARKIKLPKMYIFLQKQVTKFSCTYWLLWFSKILKKILWGWSRVKMIRHFRDQNGQFFMENFFWYKPLSLLSSTYWSFSLCKIEKKNLTTDPELCECAIFGPKIVHLPQTIFFWKLLKSFSSIY